MLIGWWLILVLLGEFLTAVYSKLMFTSPYSGKQIFGTIGSNVTFTWSFSGVVDTITWRLKNPSGTQLIVLDPNGGESRPAPSSYIQRVNGVFVGSASSGQAIFTISDIKKGDDRSYTCELFKSSDTGFVLKEDHVKLSVEEKPDITHPTEASKSFIESSHVNISCTAMGKRDPGVSWSHDGKVMSLGSGTAHLIFSKINRSDAGTYVCKANNSAGITEKQLNVTVNYKPEGIAIRLSNRSVLQGGTVKILCVVKASNPPVSEYQFFFNGSLFRTKNSNNEITIGNLQRYRNNGNYSCEAKNSVGSVLSDKAFLNINVPVKIEPFSKNTTVTEGNPIKLTCYASGYPVPSVVWMKNGEEIRSMSVLNIGSINRTDSGRYICIASNLLGKEEMETFVIVNYPASITQVLPLSPRESWIPQNVTFVCKANGVPNPTVIWKGPSGTEIKKVVASLNIVSVRMQSDKDFGPYKCEANNSVGSATIATVLLKQIKPPGAPTITTQDKDIRVKSLIVKWTPPGDNGGSGITGYRVIVLHGGNVIINKTTNSSDHEYFVDNSLTKSMKYTLRVSALNKVFEGMADEKNVTTKYQGAPATAQIVDLPPVTKAKEVTIKWSEPQDNGAPIILYAVYQRVVRKGDIKGKWIKIREIKDISRRQVVVSLEKNKVYEFVVTATNRFGESFQEGKHIRKLVVSGDIPEPVENIKVEEKEDSVTLSWHEPEDNGAAITRYSIYSRTAKDENWTKVADLEVEVGSKLEYTFKLVRGKNFELIVTATNEFGESAKNEGNIQTVELPNRATADPNAQKGPTGVDPAIVAGAAAVGILLMLGLIILVIWRKRRKTPSETGSATAGLQGPYPEELADEYSAVGAPSAAQQLQEGRPVPDVTYAQIDKSKKKKKKNKAPVTELYAQVDKSKKSNKKHNKQPGELEYAELDDFRPNTQPAPQASGATARPLFRAPVYEGTEYADITQFGVPQSEPTYGNVPRKKDVVYSNVESM